MFKTDPRETDIKNKTYFVSFNRRREAGGGSDTIGPFSSSPSLRPITSQVNASTKNSSKCFYKECSSHRWSFGGFDASVAANLARYRAFVDH